MPLRAPFFILIALLAWAPLVLGSNRPALWVVNAAIAAAGLLALAAAAFGRGLPVRVAEFAAPAIGFAAVVLLIAAQAAPVAPSGLADPSWAAASAALGVDLPGSISVDRQATLDALMRLLTCGAVFFVALQTCRAPDRASRLVAAVFWIAVAYGAYGLLIHFAGSSRILFFDRFAYEGVVLGTFIGRNAFAAFLGVGLAAGTVLVLRSLSRVFDAKRASSRFARWMLVEELVKRAGVTIVGCVVLSTAILLTGSRAGAASSLGACLVAIALWRLRAGAGGAGRAVLVSFLLLVGATGALSGAVVLERLEDAERSAAFRMQLYAATAEAIAERPLLGGGAGAFPALFPEVRPVDLPGTAVFGEAHNTYLELAATLGLPGALLLVGTIGLVAWRIGRGLFVRRRDHTAPLAALAAAVLFGLHSFVDFSAQLQANAILLSALLGAGLAQSWRRGALDGDAGPGGAQG